jgi:hypothetical protein
LHEIPDKARIDQISHDGSCVFAFSPKGLLWERRVKPRESKSDETGGPDCFVTSFDYVGQSGLIVATHKNLTYLDRRERKAAQSFALEGGGCNMVRSLSKVGTSTAALDDGNVALFTIPLPK